MIRYLLLLLLGMVLCSCGKPWTEISSKKHVVSYTSDANNVNTITIDSTDNKSVVIRDFQNVNSGLYIISPKDEISSVQASVQKLNNQLKLTQFIAVIACVFSIVLIVLFAIRSNRKYILKKQFDDFKKNIKDTVVKIVVDSSRINDEFAKRYSSKSNVSISQPKFSEHDFEDAVYKCVTDGKVKGYLNLIYKQKNLSATTEQALNQTRNGDSSTIIVDTMENSIVSENKVEPKYELYARDSETDTLTGIHTSFQKGKSIYKLLLQNKDDRYADITLCIDQEGVQRRILSTDSDMLTPICSIERRSSEPQKVIVEKNGKAKMIDSDSWRVTTQISVILG